MLTTVKIVRPLVTIDEAKSIAETYFELSPVEVTELNSYDDRNFKVIAKDSHDSVKEYTLKITNSVDSQDTDRIHAVNEISFYLRDRGFNVPVPISTKDGSHFASIKLEPGPSLHLVRLLTFVSGHLLRTVPYTDKVLFQSGKLLGNVANALKGYDHRAFHRQFSWSLLTIPDLRNFVHVIEDLPRREFISDVISLFEDEVLKSVEQLESGIIHGDFNEQNILAVSTDNDFNVHGFIDFGDTHYAPVIFDLAILCTYVMLDCTTMEPTKAPYFVIKGYSEVRPVKPEEFKILPISVMARLSQSLVLGAYSYLNEPGNEYLLSSTKNGWKILEALKAKGVEGLLREWKQ